MAPAASGLGHGTPALSWRLGIPQELRCLLGNLQAHSLSPQPAYTGPFSLTCMTPHPQPSTPFSHSSSHSRAMQRMEHLELG